jgi:hypothetical protein
MLGLRGLAVHTVKASTEAAQLDAEASLDLPSPRADQALVLETVDTMKCLRARM